MKHLSILTIILLITSASFSQTYYINTAKKSGNWTSSGNWQVITRTDNIKVTEYIIPKDIAITLNQTINLADQGEVDLLVAGRLEIMSDKTLILSNDSKITLSGGTIAVDLIAKNENADKNNKKKEQILIGNIVKYDGLTHDELTGNLIANQLTGSSPNGFVSNAMLPVNFNSFTAAKMNDAAVAISWSNTEELNNNHFEIQRSLDGMNWVAIAIMFPETADANLHMYKYNDKFCSKGDVYYRICQIDMNGGQNFSKVKMIAGISDQTNSRIYVSAKNTVTVDLKNAESANVTVRLIGLNGIVIGQKSNSTVEKISLTAYNAIPGAYIVQVADSKGNFSSKKVLL